ncbi:hypothetical protein FRC19_010278, partial [Serendipita sp. 401]
MATLVSALAWVKRGVAAEHPIKYEIDEKEVARVSELAREELEGLRGELDDDDDGDDGGDDDREDNERRGGGMAEEDHEEDWEDTSTSSREKDPNGMDVDAQEEKDEMAKYKLDEYDQVGPQKSRLFSNIKGLTYYKEDEEDPYITLKEDDEEEEQEQLQIYGTDNLIVIAKTEDEIPQLEVYVYDEKSENIYVHHDFLLPSLPLCLEWLDFPPASSSSSSRRRQQGQGPSSTGNFIAVGTFEPEIEIWSLDTVDGLFPDAILGRPDKTKQLLQQQQQQEEEDMENGSSTKKKKKKKKKKQAKKEVNPNYHVDAVLALSWNRSYRNLLASASADTTVKLWDLSRDLTASGDDESGGAIRSFQVHRDKVQAIQWNVMDPSVLLTGSYDRTVKTFDSRAPDGSVGAMLGADVEAVRWDPWDPHCFFVSLENGYVLNFDARTLSSDPARSSSTRFTLFAHDGAVSALDVNPHIPGCLVTGGTDKLVKIWNVNETGGKRD